MQYTVMIHRQPPGRYVAHAPAVPTCRGEGRTRNEALHQLKMAIETWLIETEITTLEINTPSPLPTTEENPWLTTAGVFADDPMLEPMLQEILAAREAERPRE
jgi:predicted RNase H-like HicB family nuclease